MLIRMIWQSTDDGIADESEEESLDLIKILMIRLRFILVHLGKCLYFLVK